MDAKGKVAVWTEAAPAAIGPYTQAVRVRGMLYTSGQVGMDPRTMELVAGGIEAQTTQVLENLRVVLAAGGAELRDVVKTTVYLQDMGQFAAMNAVYGRYLVGEGVVAPARSTVEVAKLPKGALVEIDVVALIPVRG